MKNRCLNLPSNPGIKKIILLPQKGREDEIQVIAENWTTSARLAFYETRQVLKAEGAAKLDRLFKKYLTWPETKGGRR